MRCRCVKCGKGAKLRLAMRHNMLIQAVGVGLFVAAALVVNQSVVVLSLAIAAIAIIMTLLATRLIEIVPVSESTKQAE